MENGRECHVEQYKLYRSRWYILAVLTVLNFSNGVLWMSFSNIANSASIYFEASTFQIDLLSIVFMVATLVLGVPAMWLLDKKGLRLSLHVAAWMNSAGAALRLLSTLDCFHGNRYVLLLIGQTLSGCGQPFMIFAPTKLVAQWFGPQERTLANSIGSLANPLGFSIGGLLSSLIVMGSKDLNARMQLMVGVTSIPAFIGTLMTLLVLNSEPPTQPSPSSSHKIEPFFWGIRMLFGMKSYVLLSLCYGTGVGVISSLVTVVNQLLIPRGYSDLFCATVIFLLVGSGFIGAFISSVVSDKHKNHEFVAKVNFCLGAAFIILFIMLSHYPKMEVLISVVLIVAGFFCFSISPLCFELAVESSYPVAVGTSAGVMAIVGQLMSALLTLLLSIGSQPITTNQDMMPTNHNEIINRYALTSFMMLIVPTPIIFLLFFTSPNLRLTFEQTMSDVQNLSKSERDIALKSVMELHSRCICNRLENIQSPLVVCVGSDDDDDGGGSGGDDNDFEVRKVTA